jgi:hypothetical protein
MLLVEPSVANKVGPLKARQGVQVPPSGESAQVHCRLQPAPENAMPQSTEDNEEKTPTAIIASSPMMILCTPRLSSMSLAWKAKKREINRRFFCFFKKQITNNPNTYQPDISNSVSQRIFN